MDAVLKTTLTVGVCPIADFETMGNLAVLASIMHIGCTAGRRDSVEGSYNPLELCDEVSRPENGAELDPIVSRPIVPDGRFGKIDTFTKIIVCAPPRTVPI